MGFESSESVLSSCFVMADEEGAFPSFRRGANILTGLQGTRLIFNDAELRFVLTSQSSSYLSTVRIAVRPISLHCKDYIDSWCVL